MPCMQGSEGRARDARRFEAARQAALKRRQEAIERARHVCSIAQQLQAEPEVQQPVMQKAGHP